MVDFLASILGTYSPVTYQVTEMCYNPSIEDIEEITYSVVPNGLAGVDWLYILSGLLFIVVVWSVFKLLGGLICKIS